MKTRNEGLKIKRLAVMAATAGAGLASLLTSLPYFYSLWARASNNILPNGKPLGGDFICFYIAGKNIFENPQQLYDYAFTHSQQLAYFNGKDIGLLPYAYPPLLAYFFAPLSKLNFEQAAFAWLFLSASLYTTAAIMFIKALKADKLSALSLIFFALGYPAFLIYCLAGGQTSALGTFILGSYFFLRKKEKDFLAGLAFSLSYYKPPLFLLLLLNILLEGKKKILLGFALGGIILITTSLIFAGPQLCLEFLSKSLNYQHGSEMLPGYIHKLTQGAGLYSTLQQLNPLSGKLIFAALVAVYLRERLKLNKTSPSSSTHMSLLFALDSSASLLFSIWLMTYDYTLAIGSLIITSLNLLRTPSLPLALAWLSGILIYFSPTDPLYFPGGFQIKPQLVALSMLSVCLLWAIKREERSS